MHNSERGERGHTGARASNIFDLIGANDFKYGIWNDVISCDAESFDCIGGIGIALQEHDFAETNMFDCGYIWFLFETLIKSRA